MEPKHTSVESSITEQKVTEFVKQVDLEELISLSNGVSRNNSRPTNQFKRPASRPGNIFSQFRSAVSKYATQKCIPGYKDQSMLLKVSSKLWEMTTEEHKDHFRKLAAEAERIHREKYPNYEFKTTSALKIKKGAKKKYQNKSALKIKKEVKEKYQNKSARKIEKETLQQEYFFAPNSDVFMTSGLEAPSQTHNELQQAYDFPFSPTYTSIFDDIDDTNIAIKNSASQQEFQPNDAIFDTIIPSFSALQQDFQTNITPSNSLLDTNMFITPPSYSALQQGFQTNDAISDISSMVYDFSLPRWNLPTDIRPCTYSTTSASSNLDYLFLSPGETNADFINLNPDNEGAVINDNFIRIKYSEPVVTIGSGSRVLNDISEFISVHSTISQKLSNTAYSEAEQLFSKLKERKNDIDNILYSQNVYAVGPDFQNDYSTPCIACWVAEPLNLSVMKQLSEVFDDKFDVVYYLVDIKGGNNNYGKDTNESVNRNGNISNLPNSDKTPTSKITKSFNTNKNIDNLREGDNDDDNDDDGGDYGGGDSDDYGSVNAKHKKIEISSDAKIESEDKKSQCFNITVHLWASIKLDSEFKDMNTLKFKIHLENCSTENLLSDQSHSLRDFACYYLESLDINVFPKEIMSKYNDKSPEPNNETSVLFDGLLSPPSFDGSPSPMLIDESSELNYRSFRINNESSESDEEFPIIMLKEEHTPFSSNNHMSISKTKENGKHIQMEVGMPQSIKMGFSHDTKDSQSSTATVKEWNMDFSFGSTNGVQWKYKFSGGDVFNIGEHRKSIRIDEPHRGHWRITNKVGGFCITITQVLGHTKKLNFFRKIASKEPELIKQYPKIVHKL
ncbi:hypothetical protein C2G38_2166431 [Gigaspora rosea]|uniref:HMG box domain-containing protein n=1 Tax=Gigaspora rosea TaxID=44941 RepID=A0A397W1M3_9GLOM|nr:hypothetical protein C2G38_2166431 [Gigaspora rosea]